MLTLYSAAEFLILVLLMTMTVVESNQMKPFVINIKLRVAVA